MKTRAKCNLVMMGLALAGVLLAGSGAKHSAAPAEQAQAAKAAETLARAACQQLHSAGFDSPYLSNLAR